MKPDEYADVRYSLASTKVLGGGLLSATPSGDIKRLTVGQPVYRVHSAGAP